MLPKVSKHKATTQTGQAMASYSTTWWWSKWEVTQQVYFSVALLYLIWCRSWGSPGSNPGSVEWTQLSVCNCQTLTTRQLGQQPHCLQVPELVIFFEQTFSDSIIDQIVTQTYVYVLSTPPPPINQLSWVAGCHPRKWFNLSGLVIALRLKISRNWWPLVYTSYSWPSCNK